MPRRIAIVGGGISGLGVARALARHPDRFDLRLFEAESRFSYSVRYRGGLCAHGFDSDIRRRL